MTTTELLEALRPLSRMSVYRHLRALKIKPLGIRQRPQHWPDHAPEKIRARLGMATQESLPARRLELITGPALRRIKKNGRKQ